MGLVFPWVFYIGIPILLVLLLFNLIPNKKQAYHKGKKVANTNLLEETPLYKKLFLQYKILCILVLASLLIAIALCFVMLARPAKIDTINPQIHNRDIFLCIDTSDSVDELNLEICDQLKNVVKELNGERFGITIFNGQSVLLVPLTTDYDYILDTLDKLELAFKESLGLISSESGFAYYYKYNGTLCDYGSSFIGDGLASCLYNFPDLKENKERSRLIIFTTDNQLNGTPFVTLEDATRLCTKNDVKVFAVAPDNIEEEAAFKAAIEGTGGCYYQSSNAHAFDKLIKDIQKTNTSTMETVQTIITDQPQLLFGWLLLFIGIYLVASRKVKL
ncbi:MAG: hypothetical protein IJF07_07440 [Lachnospiraceae bacterium]|nr:hypothetical protein [Lachnospiraceae bacterium]